MDIKNAGACLKLHNFISQFPRAANAIWSAFDCHKSINCYGGKSNTPEYGILNELRRLQKARILESTQLFSRFTENEGIVRQPNRILHDRLRYRKYDGVSYISILLYLFNNLAFSYLYVKAAKNVYLHTQHFSKKPLMQHLCLIPYKWTRNSMTYIHDFREWSTKNIRVCWQNVYIVSKKTKCK